MSRIFEFLISNQHFPGAQQQGFQKPLRCLTTSFDLQETILHKAAINM